MDAFIRTLSEKPDIGLVITHFLRRDSKLEDCFVFIKGLRESVAYTVPLIIFTGLAVGATFYPETNVWIVGKIDAHKTLTPILQYLLDPSKPIGP